VKHIIMLISISCAFIGLLSIIITIALIYKYVKKETSYGGFSLLSIPLLLMGLLLLLYTIGRDILLFNFSTYPCSTIICLTWLLIELCIFVYSLITKEDTFLYKGLFFVFFLFAMIPTINSMDYKLPFYICVFVGVLFPTIDLFRCNLTK
jgi:hypothetical protein